MEAKEMALGYLEQPKEEADSPPPSSDDETEPEDSDDAEEAEEEEPRAGARARAAAAAALVSGPPLKKGPWTPEEDKRLRTYVEAHGEGNWNQVQRNAGLNRCGKSCRLRWANHLRPHLKKGPFSEEEEQLIIELHAKNGNKWAQMASKLPGRTDNEIKNFWNTRRKRLTKRGQDVYPEELISRMKNQDMDSHSSDDSCGNKRPNELSQETSLELLDIIKFENLDYLKRPENFFVPTYRIQDSCAMNPSKRHASSDTVSGYSDSPTCEQFPHEPERTCYTDINMGITNHSVCFNCAIANGLPILDGNFSTSGTMLRPVKMELPSLQNTSFESINSCLHITPATPLDMADTFIPSPPSVLMISDCFLTQNMVQQQGQILGDSATFQAAYEVPVPYVHPLSPHSSVINDSVLDRSPLDEFRTSKSPASLDALLADSKHQADDIFAEEYLSPLADSCRPGASAEARYLSEDSPNSEYQPISDPYSSVLYGDLCDEGMFSAPGAGYQHRLESVPWNSMPGARHVPGS